MKNKWKTMIASVLCLACLPMPLTASAEVKVDGYDYTHPYADDLYHCAIVEADTFTYTVNGWYTNNDPTATVNYKGSGYLETDAVDVNYIVAGVMYREGENKPCSYILNDLGMSGDSVEFNAGENDFDTFLNGETLKPGDLLYIENYEIAEIYPGCLHAYEEIGSSIQVLGNGIDIFGEDFKKVLYYEMYTDPYTYYTERGFLENPSGFVYEVYDKSLLEIGNLNNDDSIDLLDVITLNKNIMTGYPIGYYAKSCADVDNNGVVNAVDSLNILKYCVGLIDSFDEL